MKSTIGFVALPKEKKKEIIQLQKRYAKLENDFMKESNKDKKQDLWNRLKEMEKKQWLLVNGYE